MSVANTRPKNHSRLLLLLLFFLNKVEVVEGGHGFVLQLFHQLWLTTQASRRDVLEDDLGHVDNLLGIRTQRIEETEDVHQLFAHQRHRDVKNRQRRRGVDDLVHGVLLNPLLRPDLVEAVSPGAPELRHTVVVVERKVLCAGLLGEECIRNFACTASRAPPPTLAFFCPGRAAW